MFCTFSSPTSTVKLKSVPSIQNQKNETPASAYPKMDKYFIYPTRGMIVYKDRIKKWSYSYKDVDWTIKKKNQTKSDGSL